MSCKILIVEDDSNIAKYIQACLTMGGYDSEICSDGLSAVERACELIAEKKYLISEISYRLAFENAYYFAKVFRRYTGMSPSEWEKANAGTEKLEN